MRPRADRGAGLPSAVSGVFPNLVHDVGSSHSGGPMLWSSLGMSRWSFGASYCQDQVAGCPATMESSVFHGMSDHHIRGRETKPNMLESIWMALALSSFSKCLMSCLRCGITFSVNLKTGRGFNLGISSRVKSIHSPNLRPSTPSRPAPADPLIREKSGHGGPAQIKIAHSPFGSRKLMRSATDSDESLKMSPLRSMSG